MHIGIIFAILTAIISGFSIFYNKLVITQGIDSLIFNILKNGGVAIVLTLLIVLTGQIRHLKSLTKKQWIKLSLIGLIGGSIPFVLFFEGLKTIPAAQASLIQKSLFIWVAMLALPMLKERLNRWQIVAYSLIAWSNLFIGGIPAFRGTSGELMVHAATILWSIEYVIAKIALRDIHPSFVAWSRMALGSLVLIGVALSQNKLGLIATVPPHYFLPIAGSIIFLASYVSFLYRAIAKAPVTLVASILILATPITTVLSTGLLQQSITLPTAIGHLTTVVALLVIIKFRNVRPSPTA